MVDVIHLMCSARAITSIPHLQGAKSYPEKSRLIKYKDWIHSVMTAIESWAEKIFNLFYNVN